MCHSNGMKTYIHQKYIGKRWFTMRHYFAVCVKVEFSEDEIDAINHNSLQRQIILSRIPADDIATENVNNYALTVAHLLDQKLDCHCCATQRAANEYEKIVRVALAGLEVQLERNLVSQI